MPVSVVFGGQFGSEGKGKVACWLADNRNAKYAIRVGGSNSGHTVVAPDGQKLILRHLPTAAVLPTVQCLVAAGSYIDPDVFFDDLDKVGLDHSRVTIDPNASIITENHKTQEAESNLRDRVASTLSGTGASLQDRINRRASFPRAKDNPRLAEFVGPVKEILRNGLNAGHRIIVEGTQGYGLSLIHSPHYPYVTSRDTTASAFLAEAGVSPVEADELVMVLRAYPIRVGGTSGPLPKEIDWSTITDKAGSPHPLRERTSVSGTVRRVAEFDPAVVREAIRVNQPTKIVLNHLDYVDWDCRLEQRKTRTAHKFISNVSEQIGRSIDYFGFGPGTNQLGALDSTLEGSVQNRSPKQVG